MYFYIYFYSNNFGSTDKVHVFYQMASTQPLKVRGKEKKTEEKETVILLRNSVCLFPTKILNT